MLTGPEPASGSTDGPASRGTIRVHALVDSLSIGGAEMLLPELAAAAPAEGIELSVGYLQDMNGSPGIARLRARGVEPRLVGVRRLGPGAVRQVRRQLQEVRPDVLHTHLGYSDLLGGLAARTLRLPAVATVHSMRWDAEGRERVKEEMMTRARRGMDRVVMVSDFARERYLAEGRDRPEHLVVVRNGITGTPAPGAGAAVRAELGIGSDELVVTIMAVLRPEKAHVTSIEAIRRLRERLPNARLLIAGDGPSRPQVEAAAAAAGDGVVMAGFRSDVMAVLDASDVLLHAPSYDALPTSIIEAMAASVPIVATRVGGIPELVGDEAAVLVPAPPSPEPLADALHALLTDPDRRARLGAAGRARFERELSATAWARRLRAVYDDVLAAA